MDTSRWSRFFVPILLASTLAAAPGCFAAAHPVYEVTEAPPPPRAEVVDTRLNQIWIRGHWEFLGGHWAWHEGVRVRERPGYSWVQGKWVDLGGRWQWHPGHWNEGPIVRDHRH